jgi:hypothetical protein
MVDEEVESVLNEIRERVRAQPVPLQTNISRSPAGNGVGDLNAELAADATPGESLALIVSYLTTTARAWDRLPPLVSNRNGALARMEISLKKYFKRATRWFTWEQVNFNAAVHHALRDTVRTLSAYEQNAARILEDIEALRLELKQQIETAAQETRTAEQETRRAAQATTESIQAAIEVATQAATKNATQAAAQMVAPIATQLAELAKELRERDERLQDEQRVCFKQLSLETTETTVNEDRARRKTEALVEELKRRVEQLEK